MGWMIGFSVVELVEEANPFQSNFIFPYMKILDDV
jgi:hypothetical protein